MISKSIVAAASHVVIDSKGHIKICTMDNLSYCNGSIGNVIQDDIKSIFEKNAELLNILYDESTEKINSAECQGVKCVICNGCLLR